MSWMIARNEQPRRVPARPRHRRAPDLGPNRRSFADRAHRPEPRCRTTVVDAPHGHARHDTQSRLPTLCSVASHLPRLISSCFNRVDYLGTYCVRDPASSPAASRRRHPNLAFTHQPPLALAVLCKIVRHSHTACCDTSLPGDLSAVTLHSRLRFFNLGRTRPTVRTMA